MNNKYAVNKICIVCGTPFTDYSKNHIAKHCSNSCRYKNYRSKHAKTLQQRRKEAYTRNNIIDYAREWRHNNPEKVKAIQKRSRLKDADKRRHKRNQMRYEVLKYISKNDKVECAVCGFNNFNALNIDHINGGGNAEYRRYFKTNPQTGYWKHILSLPKEKAQQKYQILCANCNSIKRIESKEHLKRY